MKTITLAIALITLASAASADCLSIKAYDLRQACFAQARQDPRDCTSVKDWDAREVCRQRAGQRDMWGRRQDGLDARR
jgi:hypothetical protein